MAKRLAYLDIAKGLLITCLCFHHITQALRINGISDILLWPNASFAWYACYFMQAFFIITGFCTNFEKSAKEFFLNNIKTLLIPSIAITITRRFFLYSVYGIPNQTTLQWFYLEWFLITLLLCKIILWLIVRYLKKDQVFLIGGGISVVMLLVCTFDTLNFSFTQWLYYKNVLAMFAFLFIGWALKNGKYDLKTFQKYGFHMFIFLQILHYSFNVDYPIVTASVDLYIREVPLYLLCSFSGSMFILHISKILERYSCTLLQDIGKNTLVIYGFHYIYVRLAVLLLQKANLLFLDNNFRIGITYFMIGTFTLVMSYLTARVINHYKFLSFYTGKW